MLTIRFHHLFIIYALFFFLNDPPTTEIYTTRHTLSLHDALPIRQRHLDAHGPVGQAVQEANDRSEEHTSELQSRLVISYAVFCLKKKKIRPTTADNCSFCIKYELNVEY